VRNMAGTFPSKRQARGRLQRAAFRVTAVKARQSDYGPNAVIWELATDDLLSSNVGVAYVPLGIVTRCYNRSTPASLFFRALAECTAAHEA